MVRDSTVARARDELLPVVIAALIGGLVLVLRPPIPLDEIRYLEVLRENSRGAWWLLTLNSEPYADKPPLLFWLARLLSMAGVPSVVALRILPPLCTALTVALTARLGRRLGLDLAGWMLAAMAMPLIYSMILLFDPLLSVCVWAAVFAWSRGRDGWALVFAAGAFLGKGPVAALFLAPFAWAVTPLRPQRGGTSVRGLVMLVLAVLPLAAWALVAARSGGESFQTELFWDKWMGRIRNAPAHALPWYFYGHIALLGALPATPLLFFPLNKASDGARVTGRLGRAALLILVLFSFMSGKQPHYLLPLAPVAALYAAAIVNDRALARTLFMRISWLVPACVLVLACVAIFSLHSALRRYGSYAEHIESSWVKPVALTIAFAGSLGALAISALARRGVRTRLGAMMLACFGFSAAAHIVGGRILMPESIASALRAEPGTAFAIYHNMQAGLYNWLTESDQLENPRSPAAAEQWTIAHPGGLLVCEDKNLAALAHLPLTPLVHDLVRGTRSTLLRVSPPENPEGDSQR